MMVILFYYLYVGHDFDFSVCVIGKKGKDFRSDKFTWNKAKL